MQLIASQNVNVATGGAAQVSLPLSSLNNGQTVEHLYLRLNGTLTLPVIAAGDMEPEHVSQMLQGIQLQYGAGNINIDGADLERYIRARWAYRSFNNNRTYPDNAATVISHVLVLPLVPTAYDSAGSVRRKMRIPTIMLRGQRVQFTLNTAALGADITSFVGQVEVWADGDIPAKDSDDGSSPLFMSLSATADVNGSQLNFPRADLVVFGNTASFAQFQVDGVIETPITPAEHAQFYRWQYPSANGYRYNETRTSLVDPALYTFLEYVGGARTTPQLCVAYDRRNHKNPSAGAFIRLMNRNAAVALPIITEYATT